jgi:hypothetical protein
MSEKKLETIAHVFHGLEIGIVDRGKVSQGLSQAGIPEAAIAKFMDDIETMPEYALPFIRGFLAGSGALV